MFSVVRPLFLFFSSVFFCLLYYISFLTVCQHFILIFYLFSIFILSLIA